MLRHSWCENGGSVRSSGIISKALGGVVVEKVPSEGQYTGKSSQEVLPKNAPC